MDEAGKIQKVPFPRPVEPAQRGDIARANAAASRSGAAGDPSFAELLRARQGIAPSGGIAPRTGEADALKFSAHAQTRMQSRQIALGEGQMTRLHSAVQKAAGKGARDALVLMDGLAMVVSVRNRTVVTVVDKDNLKQNVFTNIDSAVIA